MTKKIVIHYSYIVLSPKLPVVLTIMADGCPTIALAGEPVGLLQNPKSSAGSARGARVEVSDGEWLLSVLTESDDTIVVRGKSPKFGSANNSINKEN